MTLPPDDSVFNFSIEPSDEESTTIGDVFDNNYNVTLVDLIMERLAMTLNVYYTPMLIVLGCVGNIISLIVFYKSKLRLQSTSQYLSALALSDTLFLFQLLPPWLKAVGASTLFSRNGFCQLFVYLSYVTCNQSSWLVVAFTIERFVAVVYPLRRNVMCTVRRARLIIGSLAVAALLVNLPVLRFAVPSGNDCNIDELLMEHAARFNLVDTAISFTIPLAVIVILNYWIMRGVYRVSRARPNLSREQRAGARVPLPERAFACQRSQQRVTRMLLIVSSVFVLLNLPAYTMRIVAYANNMGEHEYSGKWAALQQVCLLFFNTNFGINFVLYCMTGQNFRRALLETFPWFRRRRNLPMELHGVDTDRAARASSISTSFVRSLSNNYTEATMTCANYEMNRTSEQNEVEQAGFGPGGVGRNYARRLRLGQVESAGPTRPDRQAHNVIKRWKFDNTRQQRRTSLEWQQLPDGNV